jgi:NADH-quinone oxidoreductase subunit M
MITDPIILVWLIAIPFLGGLLSWIGELAGGIRYPRWIALFTMVLVLIISLWLWAIGDWSIAGIPMDGAAPQWVLEFQVPWIERFGISFHLGLDGLSLLLVVLTNLLGLMAVACSWKEIGRYVGFFHLNLLWNLGGVVAVFLALDLFLFFFFWEMMLVPMYFLIAIWGHNAPGGKGRIYAATKFFIFTQASGLLMLLAILGLVWVNHQATGVWSFDYHVLLQTEMSSEVQWILMLGFFVAFMVKLPVVPFHTWLPDAHSQAPTAGSVDLAGILLKTAAYGLMRFGLPLFPEASASFAPVAMWLGVVGIVYGAFMTFAQNDVKRLVAYSSVSHMGFVLVGIYAGTELALQGAMITMIAHGISAGALFILCGEIYERIHTRDLREMGGLWARFPYLPPIVMFFALAALGLPGLGNFVGEFLVLIGTWSVDKPVTIVAATGLILAAVYSLMMIQRAFHGKADTDEKLEDLNYRELVTCLSLMALLLWLGVYPQPVLDTSAAVMQAIHALYSPMAGAAP